MFRDEPSLDRMSEAQADALGVFDRPITDLGLPERGSLVTARAPGRPTIQFLLD